MKEENRYKLLKSPVGLEQHTEIEIRSDITGKIVKNMVQTRERQSDGEVSLT